MILILFVRPDFHYMLGIVTPWGGDSRQSCIAVYWSEAPLQEWREGAAGTHGAPCNIARPTPVGGQHLTTCCLVRMATKVGNVQKKAILNGWLFDFLPLFIYFIRNRSH